MKDELIVLLEKIVQEARKLQEKMDVLDPDHIDLNRIVIDCNAMKGRIEFCDHWRVL